MKIISVAFDGPNRSGKGLQVELLSSRLKDEQIPYVAIRGDGSRGNKELATKNSAWWEEISTILQSSSDLKYWDIAACKLAEELVYYKKTILPEIIKKSCSDWGLLIIDRSVLSRAVLVSEYLKKFSMDDLYPKQFFENRKKLTVWDVLPDIIFLLSAPKEILFSRLDKSDQKYLFRKTLIEKKGDWYGQVIGLFPQTIKNRIVAMDATESPAELHTKVVKIINAYRNDQ